MLNLNQDENEEEPVWKLLVFDRLGQDIISPLLKVGDLREKGVTVHMPIHSDRQPIQDAPAIYFVEPTAANINRISQDLSNQLYSSFYINFSSALPRFLLEDLASKTAANSNLVSQIYDQYLNFVCLEDNLFSLQRPDAYHILNNPESTEKMIEELTDFIASSLFSILVTKKIVPVIKCPRGNAAESIALKLEGKLRDNIMNTRFNLFPADSNSSRPVLILLDRNMDLTSLLSHTWTYSTLVHDILGMQLNRVSVPVEENGRSGKRNYDIDSNDFFWAKNAGNPFPTVAEDVDSEINIYKEEVDKVTKFAGVSSLEEMDPSGVQTGAKGLTSAIQQLPELTKKKKLLDMHMTIATALFKKIQSRQLDAFVKIEESVHKLNKQAVLEIIRDASKQPEDKMRLFLMFFLQEEDVPRPDILEYRQALETAGCNISALDFAITIRMYSSLTTSIPNSLTSPQVANSSGDLLGSFTTNLSRFTDTIQSSGHFEALISGVKNLLPNRKELLVTQTVDEVMEGVGASRGTDQFLYLDPKLPRGHSKAAPGKSSFQDAIVFVVGGGNYFEYQNLMEYVQRSNLTKKNIVYGSTELYSAQAFLSQMESLGKNKPV